MSKFRSKMDWGWVMDELGADQEAERPNFPMKPRRGHFVQTDRAAHEAWARLGTKHPAASALLHVLAANVGDHNAVVASHKILARLMGASSSTVKRALKTLSDGNWIEVQQIGASGTVNAYVLNSRVVWTEARDRLRYARWKDREVDMVSLDPAMDAPSALVEVKWSDRALDRGGELKGIVDLARRKPPRRTPLVTTLSRSETREVDGVAIDFVPTSLHCYTISRNLQDQT